MSRLYYFRSASEPDRHAFTDDQAGARLPPDEGPWRLVRAVAPDEGWTSAAGIEAVRAGVRINGFFVVESAGELAFDEAAVKPGD